MKYVGDGKHIYKCVGSGKRGNIWEVEKKGTSKLVSRNQKRVIIALNIVKVEVHYKFGTHKRLEFILD